MEAWDCGDANHDEHRDDDRDDANHDDRRGDGHVAQKAAGLAEGADWTDVEP